MAVFDATEAVKARVMKKVEESKLPKPVRGAVAKRAGAVACNVVKRSGVAKEMASKLCKRMPAKMKDAGVTVVLEEVFREEHYFVLELQVQHVDTVAVERSQREARADLTADDKDVSTSFAGTMLNWTLRLMGKNNQRLLEDEYLPAKVQQKLETEMMDILEEKFANMQMKADVEILKEKKQARYFYSKLKTVRQEVEASSRVKNPIKELRKKISSEQENVATSTSSESL